MHRWAEYTGMPHCGVLKAAASGGQVEGRQQAGYVGVMLGKGAREGRGTFHHIMSSTNTHAQR